LQPYIKAFNLGELIRGRVGGELSAVSMEVDYHFYIPFLLKLSNHPLRSIKCWIKLLHKLAK
jgi:hypothetical protein